MSDTEVELPLIEAEDALVEAVPSIAEEFGTTAPVDGAVEVSGSALLAVDSSMGSMPSVLDASMIGEEKDAESVGSADSSIPNSDALFDYCRRGEADMVTRLLVAGTPWDSVCPVVCSSSRLVPAWYCCRCSEIECIALRLSQSQLRPLHMAVLFGKFKCVVALLKAKGAKIDVKDRVRCHCGLLWGDCTWLRCCCISFVRRMTARPCIMLLGMATQSWYNSC
jgi:hypothetical protein